MVRQLAGQRQRRPFAHALCKNPKVMLFDERPTGLDPETAREGLDAMVSPAREGMTMICFTHDINFARKVADGIVFMAVGEIVKIGTPEQMVSRPGQARTRAFFSQPRH